MSDDRELVERLAAIDASPHADWVAELRADLDAAWETGDTVHLNSPTTTTPTLIDPRTGTDATDQPSPVAEILIAAAAVVLVVAALVLVTRDDGERQVPAGPPAGPAAKHGLIAFSGGSGESRAESDTEIFVVAPDGTGLRALTSTPGVSEMAPRWSPDGTRLAFLRGATVVGSNADPGELVVIDPSTGVETFSDVIPNPPNSDVGPPKWSPDGRLIVFDVGNSAQSPLAVDLETGAWTPMSLDWFQGWSPDGRWFVLQQMDELFLVPADLFGSPDLDDVSNLPGVRPLQGFFGAWMPDSSAVAISLPDGSTDVVTIADGQRRTLIEDGSAPTWSPDGSHIAYSRCVEGTDPLLLPPDTVPADMASVDPRQPDAAVWVAAADGTSARPVATSLEPPIWSPDGSLLIAAGEDGLFMLRPDGTGMTRLTTVMTPQRFGGGDTACDNTHSFFGPVWQPVPPSAETVADAVLPDRVVTSEAPAATTTEPSTTTDE